MKPIITQKNNIVITIDQLYDRFKSQAMTAETTQHQHQSPTQPLMDMGSQHHKHYYLSGMTHRTIPSLTRYRRSHTRPA